MGVAESRFGDVVDDGIIAIKGFSSIRQDRNTQGGGVVLYIRSNLRATILARSDTTKCGKPNAIEYLMCCITGEKIPPIFVCLIYRPSYVSFEADPQFLTNLRDLCTNYSHKIIMGDLNSDLLVDSNNTTFMKDLFNELALQIVNHEATRRPPGSSICKTWIDVMCIDSNDVITNYSNRIPSFLSDHNLIDVEIEKYVPKPPMETFSFRKFNDIMPEAINEILTHSDWSDFTATSFDLDHAVNSLSNNLQTAIDTLAPLKTVNPRKSKHPWIDDELDHLKRKRKSIERRYLNSKNVSLLKELLQLTEEIETLSKSAHNEFIRTRLDDAIDNNRDIWREMKNLGLIPTPRSDLHGFSLNDLNTYFASVSTSQTENLDSTSAMIDSVSNSGFNFKEVTFNDVILAVAHFSSQATGSDGIPHKVIAKSLPTIGPLLVKLFNESLLGGTFPVAWKKSLLVAIKKTSFPSSPSDFRPVALLCFLAKVLEKLAHDQIADYLQQTDLLDPLQTGFRPFSSCETALIKLSEDIRFGKNKKLVTLLLQFDFSKAFDSISPSKLIEKLISIGFSKNALLWIKSYLQGRQLQVTNKISTSDPLEVNLGVPQGSVLGPLLFCIYINDVNQYLQDDICYLLYADDLQIYTQATAGNIQEAITKLSLAAHNIHNWAKAVSLRLSPDKTKAIYFGTSYFVDQLDRQNLPGVMISEGVTVPFVKEIKSLGVILDNRLNWKAHITSIGKKVNRVLYTLRFVRQCTTETLRIKLVQALVVPHLDFCSVVYLDCSSNLQDRIQRLSNSCLRYIFGVRRDSHITPYRERLGWLTCSKRRLYFSMIIMYKILRLGRPEYLAQIFVRYTSKKVARGELVTRELALPKSEKWHGNTSFQIQGTKSWNSLPSKIRFLPSLNSFKSALFTYLKTLNHMYEGSVFKCA